MIQRSQFIAFLLLAQRPLGQFLGITEFRCCPDLLTAHCLESGQRKGISKSNQSSNSWWQPCSTKNNDLIFFINFRSSEQQKKLHFSRKQSFFNLQSNRNEKSNQTASAQKKRLFPLTFKRPVAVSRNAFGAGVKWREI